MNAGITSQYGFLYQRLIFVYKVLKNISPSCLFVFEGKDDIDVLPAEQISSITQDQSTYVQVKSGTVDQNCFNKIICNWLLMNDKPDPTYVLILENELSFEYDIDSQIANIYDYITKGKEKKRTAISRKTYELFKAYIDIDDTDCVKQKIKTILEMYTKTIISLDDLERTLLEIFKRDYCQDVVQYDIATQKRFNRFLQLLNAEIDNAIKSRAPYSLIYSQFFSIVSRVREEISDTKYTVDVTKYRKDFNSEATRIVTENSSREVKQLMLVNPDAKFIVDNIINELFYKDFRQVYEIHKETSISNIEETAHENFKDARFSLSPDEQKLPKKVFTETVDRPIVSDLMPNSPIYRKGCYVYLTGDFVDEEKQITWGDDNNEI